MGILPQISLRPKMRRVTIFLAILALANATQSPVQFQNSFNQVNPEQAAPREAQNFGDSLDSYGAPEAGVLGGETTYEEGQTNCTEVCKNTSDGFPLCDCGHPD